MTRHEERIERFKVGVQSMPAGEREALKTALHGACSLETSAERATMVKLITEIGAARGRAVRRRESDARTDQERRRLVGPRVSQEQAERCKRCAAALGVSLYRFSANALIRECERVERMLNENSAAETE